MPNRLGLGTELDDHVPPSMKPTPHFRSLKREVFGRVTQCRIGLNWLKKFQNLEFSGTFQDQTSLISNTRLGARFRNASRGVRPQQCFHPRPNQCSISRGLCSEVSLAGGFDTTAILIQFAKIIQSAISIIATVHHVG
jgi:hypothetical protein